MFRVFIHVVLLVGGSALFPVPAQNGAPLARFVGNWSCKGNFTSNGAPIAADLTIQLDSSRRGGLADR
jgi:hypothetical protein